MSFPFIEVGFALFIGIGLTAFFIKRFVMNLNRKPIPYHKLRKERRKQKRLEP